MASCLHCTRLSSFFRLVKRAGRCDERLQKELTTGKRVQWHSLASIQPSPRLSSKMIPMPIMVRSRNRLVQRTGTTNGNSSEFAVCEFTVCKFAVCESAVCKFAVCEFAHVERSTSSKHTSSTWDGTITKWASKRIKFLAYIQTRCATPTGRHKSTRSTFKTRLSNSFKNNLSIFLLFFVLF